MKKADKIMKKKMFIKAEMDRQLTGRESDELWIKSAARLSVLLERYDSLPKGVRMHTENYIFPAAAVYLTVKEAEGAEKAYVIIENAAIANTEEIGEKLAGLMRFPGMPSVFINAWKPVSKLMFGEDSGFQNVFYPKEKNGYRMDITACPYHRYFTILGCPELTRIFCENDERTYGDLPGVKFERSMTLGTGGSRCDFHIRKV